MTFNGLMTRILAGCGHRRIFACGLLLLTVLAVADGLQRIKAATGREPDGWIIEQMPGGTTRIKRGEIEIRDREGCTVWFREQLHAPVEIRYEAMVVDAGAPGERTSDLNCFWMASDPASPNDLFRAGHPRTGAFATYDKLLAYYVGFGGNNNATTRFRRYDGTGARPLRPEHDLSDRKFLLEPNRWYRITLVARDGGAKFIRDGEVVFEFRDANFLRDGWFGLRTVASHLRVRNVEVCSRQ